MKDKRLVITGVITAVGASLCCITPVLALISGVTGIASSFSWIEPLRPYLIGVTILILGFTWFQKLKPKKEIECNCETNSRLHFLDSKLFLSLITAFSILMLTFPYYKNVFYSKIEKKIVVVKNENIQKVNIDVRGMTCSSCEEHINHSLNKLDGVIRVQSSFEEGNTKIEFDKSKVNLKKIKDIISMTGYKVINK